jgi:hypothetical protein
MLEQDILSSLTPDEVALLRREKSLVHLTKDPTGHFKDNNLRVDFIQAAGLLVPWFYDFAEYEPDDGNLREYMADRYGFGSLRKFEGKVDADGVYHSNYEEDPPLYPMLHLKYGKNEMYTYDYGIVAFRGYPFLNKPYWFVTRMD